MNACPESAQARREPSAVIASACTWLAWVFNRMIGAAVDTSQTQTAVSQLAE